jgi:hypothetical protein
MNMEQILQLLGVVLPALIQAAEQAFGPKTGDVKKLAVVSTAQHFLTTVGVQAPPELIVGKLEEVLPAALAPKKFDIETNTLVPAEPVAPPWPKHGIVMGE